MRYEYEIVLTVVVEYTHIANVGGGSLEYDYDVIAPSEAQIREALYEQVSEVMADDVYETFHGGD